MKEMNVEWELSCFQKAEEWAKLATCPRRSVGCVLVSPRGLTLTAGYNGSPDYMASCQQAGCLLEGGHCVRAVHAEIRAISRAAKAGVVLNESTAFVTLLPCIQCMQALMLCGVREIYYDEVYDRPEKEHVHLLAEQGGIRLTERTRS